MLKPNVSIFIIMKTSKTLMADIQKSGAIKMTMANQKNKKAPSKGIPMWAWIILIIVVIFGAVVFIPFGQTAPAGTLAKEVSVAEAAKLRDSGAFMLDVREQSEWDQFHIPGATLIPLGSLPNDLNKLPKGKTIVVYCRTGHRSAQGRDILLKAGFTNVTSMAGGVTDWQSKGLPVETGQ
jgi:rhodanese-related sulfurtransferase